MAEDLRLIVKRIDKDKAEPGDFDALREAVQQGLAPSALSGRALARQIIDAVGGNRSAKVIVLAEMDRFCAALGHRESTVLEHALIEHIGLCWLRMQTAEAALTNATSVQHSADAGRYFEARLTEAQNRFLRAMALLDRLRRHPPAVQINIANQQVVKND